MKFKEHIMVLVLAMRRVYAIKAFSNDPESGLKTHYFSSMADSGLFTFIYRNFKALAVPNNPAVIRLLRDVLFLDKLDFKPWFLEAAIAEF